MLETVLGMDQPWVAMVGLGLAVTISHPEELQVGWHFKEHLLL